ncbi:MAG: iron-sulfur cluster assembly scaffold protein [Planctomycetes bacterium]|nr:iron-sulfur cluster assembly scaffold protein [Planctomycetota bacterium]
MSLVTPTATLPSRKIDARLRHPRTRGAFLPLDAARRQLGLLSVADPLGQCRIYWLIDLATSVIEDSRFIAFGSMPSHAIADVFTESVRGRTVEEASRLTIEQLEALLRDDPATPAFAEADAAFVLDLQQLALQELPRVVVLPRPAETVAYQRKRELDWSDADRSWLPLSYLKKVGKVGEFLDRAVRERVGTAIAYSIQGLHDDFRVVLSVSGVPDEQLPTIAKLLEDALRAGLHPQLSVETVATVSKKG